MELGQGELLLLVPRGSFAIALLIMNEENEFQRGAMSCPRFPIAKGFQPWLDCKVQVLLAVLKNGLLHLFSLPSWTLYYQSPPLCLDPHLRMRCPFLPMRSLDPIPSLHSSCPNSSQICVYCCPESTLHQPFYLPLNFWKAKQFPAHFQADVNLLQWGW